ncbi:MAG: hypothetical protein Greene071421_134 [Parcubacteria group bacterium Greene0714_21]|nr:MAG: hypothetical protein Greene041639_218 [Parcubacteria group bacterium Greene0416_39]TSC98537.1 MAG: hypothetical protein Greene101447_39 [Parcubacteria group bacterium Greene1014_47]TSD04298.1 MAG: hypothetical protein Greene071421_134 [Parcubacteria group bacterium Greene0714_21]
MPEEIDLDQVSVSPNMHSTWEAITTSMAELLHRHGILLSEVDEKARVEGDGSLTIFAKLPMGEVSLRVPPREWAYRFPRN